LRLIFVRRLGHEKVEMMLGAIVLFQLEQRLGQFGTNQRQARVIGQSGAIVLGRASEIAAGLEYQAFNEELAVLSEFARQWIAFEEGGRQFVLAGFGQLYKQLHPCRLI